MGLLASGHLVLKIRKKFLEDLETLVCVCRIAPFQTMLKDKVFKCQKTVDAERVGQSLPHIVVGRLLVHPNDEGCLAVGYSLLLQ